MIDGVTASTPPAVKSRLAADRFAASNATTERFFREHVDAIALTCHSMADRFQQGGRLFVCGEGAQRSDVAHVVVEFVHPVVVGKRALPAMSLPSVRDNEAKRALGALAHRGDLLMVLSAATLEAEARGLLASARAGGLLTIALVGAGGEAALPADHQFTVPSTDRCIVQEIHEMLYHVLWELVHVFLDHRTVGA